MSGSGYRSPWSTKPSMTRRPAISRTAMLVLERLSPLERASFLLHDVFGLDFAEVSRALGRSQAACRQLAARGREHIAAGRPRFPAPSEDGRRLAAAFQQAAVSGDVHALVADSCAGRGALFRRRR